MKLPSLINKPYLYFWFTSILILLKGLLDLWIDGDTTADINIHDMYIVIPNVLFAVLFALLYFIAGILYWVFKKFRLFSSLILIHTLVSICGVIVYPIILPLVAKTEDYTTYEGINIISTFLFCIVALVQPLFIINLLMAPFRRRKTAIQ